MSSDPAVLPASASSIRCERNGAIGRLVIDNQSKHNALSFDMWDSLPGLLKELDNDPEIRVIVLEGAGSRAFAAGSDISQFGERRNTPEGVALYNKTVENAVAAVGAVGKPTVARVRGYCFGGGVALALHCDMRYATADATFSIPAATLAIAYQFSWLQRLTWLIGPANAKEIMFTARRYDAGQALRMGLVNQILDDDKEVDGILETIRSLAPLTHLASKLSIDTTAAHAGSGRDACQEAIMRCFGSQDYAEGRAAFTEKRRPEFKGR
jgi:enoyl-CoA hydratase/carnithine racemase